MSSVVKKRKIAKDAASADVPKTTKTVAPAASERSSSSPRPEASEKAGDVEVDEQDVAPKTFKDLVRAPIDICHIQC